MIDGTGKTPDRDRYALFVGPYLRFPLAILSRDDATAYSLASLAGRRVAVGRGGTAYEYLKEHGGGIDIVEAEDHAEALAMVATGKADAAVENLPVAAYAIRSTGLSTVKISGLLENNFEIYTLVRKDWPLLASILKKAQDAVTEPERSALLAKWLPVYKGRLDGEPQGGEADANAASRTVTLTDRERAYLSSKKALAYCVDPGLGPHRAHRRKRPPRGHYGRFSGSDAHPPGRAHGARAHGLLEPDPGCREKTGVATFCPLPA